MRTTTFSSARLVFSSSFFLRVNWYLSNNVLDDDHARVHKTSAFERMLANEPPPIDYGDCTGAFERIMGTVKQHRPPRRAGSTKVFPKTGGQDEGGGGSRSAEDFLAPVIRRLLLERAETGEHSWSGTAVLIVGQIREGLKHGLAKRSVNNILRELTKRYPGEEIAIFAVLEGTTRGYTWRSPNAGEGDARAAKMGRGQDVGREEMLGLVRSWDGGNGTRRRQGWGEESHVGTGGGESGELEDPEIVIGDRDFVALLTEEQDDRVEEDLPKNRFSRFSREDHERGGGSAETKEDLVRQHAITKGEHQQNAAHSATTQPPTRIRNGRRTVVQRIPRYLSVVSADSEKAFSARAIEEFGLCSKRHKHPPVSFGQHWKLALAIRMMEKFERRVRRRRSPGTTVSPPGTSPSVPGTEAGPSSPSPHNWRFRRVMKMRPDLLFPTVGDLHQIDESAETSKNDLAGTGNDQQNKNDADDSHDLSAGAGDDPSAPSTRKNSRSSWSKSRRKGESSPLAFRLDFEQLTTARDTKTLGVAPICGAGGGTDMVFMALRETVPALANLWKTIRNCRLGTIRDRAESAVADGLRTIPSRFHNTIPSKEYEYSSRPFADWLTLRPIRDWLFSPVSSSPGSVTSSSKDDLVQQLAVDTCDDYELLDKMASLPPLNAQPTARNHVWKVNALRHGVPVCNCAGLVNVTRGGGQAICGRTCLESKLCMWVNELSS